MDPTILGVVITAAGGVLAVVVSKMWDTLHDKRKHEEDAEEQRYERFRQEIQSMMDRLLEENRDLRQEVRRLRGELDAAMRKVQNRERHITELTEQIAVLSGNIRSLRPRYERDDEPTDEDAADPDPDADRTAAR